MATVARTVVSPKSPFVPNILVASKRITGEYMAPEVLPTETGYFCFYVVHIHVVGAPEILEDFRAVPISIVLNGFVKDRHRSLSSALYQQVLKWLNGLDRSYNVGTLSLIARLRHTYRNNCDFRMESSKWGNEPRLEYFVPKLIL